MSDKDIYNMTQEDLLLAAALMDRIDKEVAKTPAKHRLTRWWGIVINIIAIIRRGPPRDKDVKDLEFTRAVAYALSTDIQNQMNDILDHHSNGAVKKESLQEKLKRVSFPDLGSDTLNN